MKQYYYHDGEQNQGPFTLEELAAVNLDTETFVWHTDLEDWKKANELPELADIIDRNFIKKQKAPPTVNHAKENNLTNTNNANRQQTYETTRLSDLVILFFKNPLNALHTAFVSPAINNINNTIIIYTITAALFSLGGFFLYRMYGIIYFLVPMIGMFTISLLSHFTKSLFAENKPNFKKELFTGAVSAIPYIIMLFFYLIPTFLRRLSLEHLTWFFYDPIVTYILVGMFFLMLVMIISQSLSASIARKALAWGMSFVIVLISFLITNGIITFVERNFYF